MDAVYGWVYYVFMYNNLIKYNISYNIMVYVFSISI